MRLMRQVLLVCAIPVIGLAQTDGASAFFRFGGAGGAAGVPRAFAMRPMAGRGGANRGFSGFRNRMGPGGGQQGGRGFDGRGFDGRGGRGFDGRGPGGRGGGGGPGGFAHGPGRFGPGAGGRGPQQAFMGRNGLPHRLMPGEAGFTGVPERGETRYLSREMMVHVGADVPPEVLDAAARRLGMTAIETSNLALSGGRLVHFRLPNGGDVSGAIRTLESENIGIAQPNYVFELQQDATTAAMEPKGDPAQYVIDKLHLRDAHALATGANVTIAVIDSRVDAAHPDLAGSIAAQFDAVGGGNDNPDEHGTGMTGAIAAHRRLLGVAPRVRILAIHAFSPDAQHPQQATTQSIIAGIDWAISKGARVINMSFAGPYDPLLQMALKKAREKGVVLVAAAGNNGPQSPPLYPAADENVIAVTAVDDKDRLLPQANQGPHVALAAPGVNVLETAPHAVYNFTTGTSVAAAHVSGVAALLLERNPGLDPAALEEALSTTARDLGAPGRDPLFGFGLVDPLHALKALDAKTMAHARVPEPAAPGQKKTLTSVPRGAEFLSFGPAAAPPPAQSAAAPGEGGPGAAPAPVNGDEFTMEVRRQTCRRDGAVQGVRASEMADFVAVCVGEARLACLKRAVAQKVSGSERRDFMNRCLQGS